VYGIRLLQGRDFRETDRLGSPQVVIVNESLANKFWPGESPLGKRIVSDDPDNPGLAEVIGEMQDFKCAAEFYDPLQSGFKYLRPWAQNNHRFVPFNIRATGEPAALKDSIRKTLGLFGSRHGGELSGHREGNDGERGLLFYVPAPGVDPNFLDGFIARGGGYLWRRGKFGFRANQGSGHSYGAGCAAGDIIWLFLKKRRPARVDWRGRRTAGVVFSAELADQNASGCPRH